MPTELTNQRKKAEVHGTHAFPTAQNEASGGNHPKGRVPHAPTLVGVDAHEVDRGGYLQARRKN